MKQISEEIKQLIIREFKKKFAAVEVKDCGNNIIHVKIESNSEYDAIGVMSVLRFNYDLPTEITLLTELPTGKHKVKYIMSGKSFVSEQLAKEYGGSLTSRFFWILYDENGGMFGIRHPEITSADQIKIEEICQRIEYWQS